MRFGERYHISARRSTYCKNPCRVHSKLSVAGNRHSVRSRMPAPGAGAPRPSGKHSRAIGQCEISQVGIHAFSKHSRTDRMDCAPPSGVFSPPLRGGSSWPDGPAGADRRSRFYLRSQMPARAFSVRISRGHFRFNFPLHSPAAIPGRAERGFRLARKFEKTV